MDPPSDKFKLILFIFILHGIGVLMPWNMFITAKAYFVEFKLASKDNSTSLYASYFMQHLGFASQIPNVIFNWLNVFVTLGGDLTKRIVISISVILVLFMLTVLLCVIDTSNAQGAFFWLTMITVVLLNVANGIYQNSVYGIAAILPIKYTGSIVFGSNMCGVITVLMNMSSTTVFSSPRTAAIYYFITAIFTLLVCFDTYFVLPLNKFFRYYSALNAKEIKVAATTVDEGGVPYWTVAKQAGLQLYSIFLVFFVTLATFPAVHSDIQRSSDNFPVSKEKFVMIMCFFTFNFFAMLGSLTTSWIKWPSPKFLWIPVTIRLVFIPLYLFCNYQPRGVDRKLPVLISNDWCYWIIAVLMAYSSGYLSAVAMMYSPQSVEPKYQKTAGMLSGAMLITGIFVGVLFSFVMPLLV